MSTQFDRGFTLIELILVIIILGIVGVGIGSVVRQGTQLYVDTTERDRLISESRFVIERMSRELRQALPNSVRTAETARAQCVEFVPVQWSGFYWQIPLAPDAAQNSMQILDAIGISDQYDARQVGAHSVVVYATNQQQIYTDNQRRLPLSRLTDPDVNDGRQTLMFTAAQRFVSGSPSRRYYIVSTPVSYCVSAGQIRRFANYGFRAAASVNGMGAGALMAQHVANDFSNPGERVFSVRQAILSRNALVNSLLLFKLGGEKAEFSQEVQIANTP